LKVCIDEFTFDLMVCLYTCYRICFHSELDWNLHFASYGMFLNECWWPYSESFPVCPALRVAS